MYRKITYSVEFEYQDFSFGYCNCITSIQTFDTEDEQNAFVNELLNRKDVYRVKKVIEDFYDCELIIQHPNHYFDNLWPSSS